MQENDKILPPNENILQHSFAAQPPKVIMETPFTTSSLKEMVKQVDKLISRFPYHKNQVQLQPQTNIENSIVIEQKPPKTNYKGLDVGKYNITGKSYRYERAQKELQISKPQFPQTSKSQHKVQQHYHNRQGDILSVQAHKQSRLAQQSFVNDQIKFPTHNYFITFDKNNKSNKKRMNENMSTTFNLERKVHKLQEQIKQLKKVNTSSNFYKKNISQNRSDGRMKLQTLLNSIIQ